MSVNDSADKIDLDAQDCGDRAGHRNSRLARLVGVVQLMHCHRHSD
jgi:hypothetical protein